MVTRAHIRKRLRQWYKENLLAMKELTEIMKFAGADDDALGQYKWYAEDCIRLKDLIKTFSD